MYKQICKNRIFKANVSKIKILMIGSYLMEHIFILLISYQCKMISQLYLMLILMLIFFLHIRCGNKSKLYEHV